MAKKKALPVQVDKAEAQLKDFFDMVAPSAVKFMADHFIFGDTYRCVWAIREYPPQTSDQAILSRFGDKENVTLHDAPFATAMPSLFFSSPRSGQPRK